MSDEDAYLSEESYEFEFEDDEDEVQEENLEEDQLENKYYNAKSLKDDSPLKAIEELQSIAILKDSNYDEDNIEWIFKSLKQIIKINYNINNYSNALENLEKLIEFIPKVSKNYAEESISRILNNYSNCNNSAFVNQLYDIILNFLNDSTLGGNNDRLWLKINMNRLSNYLELKDFNHGLNLLNSINSRLEQSSETTKNSFALELIAAEIELYSNQPQINLKKLNQLYSKSLNITSAVTHPRIMGIIRECGAKVHFYRGNFEKARIDFYECFKNYDEAGSPSKKLILKYLSLCSVLTENEVNPFESQETQTYSQLPEYSNLIRLLKAYDDLNLAKFNQIHDIMIKDRDELVDDEIFIHASKKILQNLISKIILNYFKSYSSISFQFLMVKLNLSEDELENKIILLANLGKLPNVQINYIDKIIDIKQSSPKSIIPKSLDSNQVYENIISLDKLNFSKHKDLAAEKQDVYMDIDSDESPHLKSTIFGQNNQNIFSNNVGVPIIQKFLNRNGAVNQSQTITNIDHWLMCLNRAIPVKANKELSQKDQIFSEQRAESNGLKQSSNNLTIDNQLSDQNTNAGILGSAITIPTELENDDDDNNEELTSIDKADLLKIWCKEIRVHRQRLALDQ